MSGTPPKRGRQVAPGCSVPPLPPPGQPGWRGRLVDLAARLGPGAEISVGEYMERYGVGQRRAVSELRRVRGLRLVRPGATGRRKADRYVCVPEDLIGEVQEAIGFTATGFPYASGEEIAEAIGDLSSNSSRARYAGRRPARLPP